MLSRADANIIEQDRQLTGLRTLMDTEAFCETLRQIAPGREIESAKARYVRYKPGTSCLVAYQVQVAGEPIDVYARCHAHDQLIKVSNARLQLEVNGPLGHGLLADPQAGIAVFVFPNDYEVKSLRKLFEGERTPRRLRRMLPAHPHLQHAAPTILRYKPERRFVGKLEAEGGPAAVLRLYPQNQFADIREKSWAFKSNTDLHIPRVVGDSERYSALSHEWVEGLTLSDALEGEGIGVLDRVAGALAALHRQRPRLGTMYSASDYCRGLTGAVDAIASLNDELGNYANELSSSVQRLVMDRAWRPQAVHGDFTADQLVVRDDRVTILDFDRAGYGDPVMDVGAFAAGMISSALAGEMTMARALELSEAFAESYWRVAGFIDTAGAQACTAGALLMTAPEPFRHRVENWPQATEALLESVDRVLGKEAIDA